MGGDSGSSWMAVDAGGAAEDTMARPALRGRDDELPSTRSPVRDDGVREARHQPASPAPRGRRRGAVEPARWLRPGVPARRASSPGAARPRVEDDYAPTASNGVVRDYTHFSLAMAPQRPVLPLGRLERRRQRADPAVAAPTEVRHRPRVRPPVPGRRRAVLRAIGSTAGTSRAAPTSCGARAPRPSRRTPTRSSSRTSRRSSTTSTSRAGTACGASSRTRSLRTSTSTICALSVFGGPIFKDTDLLYRTCSSRGRSGS